MSEVSSTGGGVFTTVSNNFLSKHLEDIESYLAEMLWIKISIVGSKDLYACDVESVTPGNFLK